jgi:hypothetical protein
LSIVIDSKQKAELPKSNPNMNKIKSKSLCSNTRTMLMIETVRLQAA